MPESISPTSKTCTKCEVEKSLEDFPPHKKGRLGRDSHCRECHRRRRREAYRADPEKERRLAREWRAANPNYGREWQARNRERRRPQRWRASYRERMAKYGHEVVTLDMFGTDEVIETYGDQCFHCSDAPFEHLDHYPIPVTKGGPHSLENVKPSCAACNFARSAEMRDLPDPLTPATA